MTFVEVKEVPNTIPKDHIECGKLQKFCMEFLESGFKYAKVEYGNEYPEAANVRSCIAITCKKCDFPIKVLMRNGEVYLARKN